MVPLSPPITIEYIASYGTLTQALINVIVGATDDGYSSFSTSF